MMSGSTMSSTIEFLGGWEIMVIAMMLPSSLGFFALFRSITRGGQSVLARQVAVCVGYALAWAGVGCVAMIISDTIYRLESVDHWLESHTSFFAGLILVLAGGFQFTVPKRRCLTICGHPASFLMRHYRRGVGNALGLGVRYGLVCLGCCWALMVVMVVLGGGSLCMMMVLTVIMFGERTMKWNNRFAGALGLACIGLGVLLAASPGAMPALTQNALSWANMGSMQTRSASWLLWCHA